MEVDASFHASVVALDDRFLFLTKLKVVDKAADTNSAASAAFDSLVEAASVVASDDNHHGNNFGHDVLDPVDDTYPRQNNSLLAQDVVVEEQQRMDADFDTVGFCVFFPLRPLRRRSKQHDFLKNRQRYGR